MLERAERLFGFLRYDTERKHLAIDWRLYTGENPKSRLEYQSLYQTFEIDFHPSRVVGWSVDTLFLSGHTQSGQPVLERWNLDPPTAAEFEASRARGEPSLRLPFHEAAKRIGYASHALRVEHRPRSDSPLSTLPMEVLLQSCATKALVRLDVETGTLLPEASPRRGDGGAFLPELDDTFERTGKLVCPRRGTVYMFHDDTSGESLFLYDLDYDGRLDAYVLSTLEEWEKRTEPPNDMVRE